MKTAHEILLENNLSRLNQVAAEKRHAELVAGATASIAAPAIVVVLWISFLALIIITRTATDSIQALVVPGLLSLAAVGHLVFVVQRREQSLRKLIQAEAPDLHARLLTGRSNPSKQHRATNRPV